MKFTRANIEPKVWKWYRELEGRMRPKAYRWAETQYALRNKPYTRFLDGRRVDLSLAKEDYDLLIKTNMLYQSLRAMLSNVVAAPPRPTCVPRSAGFDARNKARACEKMLSWMYQSKSYDTAQFDAIVWAFTAEIGWLGVRWDSMAAPPTQVQDVDADGNPKFTEVREPLTGPNGQPMMSQNAWPPHPLYTKRDVPKMIWKRMGDLRFYAPAPFNVFPEPVRDWQDAQWVIERDFVSLDAVQQSYGRSAKAVKADVDAEDQIWLGEDEQGYSRASGTHRTPLCRVLRFSHLPTVQNPEGVQAVICDGQVLEFGPLPCQMLPVHPMWDQKLPDQLFGLSSIAQAEDAQRALNASETDLHATRRICGKPSLVLDSQSKEKHTRVSSIWGKVLRENRGEKPMRWLEPPQVPSYIQQEPERIRFIIERLTGANAATQGNAEGTGSGRHALVIQSQDRAKWASTVMWLAKATEQSSRLALKLWQKFGDPEKTVSVMGENGGIVDTMIFMRDYTHEVIDVRIDAEMMMPENSEVRRQKITEMWQLGMIPDVHAAHKALGFGEMSRILGSDEGSQASARIAIEKMRMGMPVEPKWYHDNDVWVDVLLEYMREPGFEEQDPQIQQLFDLHLQARYMLKQTSQQANPVTTGQSPMPGLPGAGVMNGSPQLNMAQGQGTDPGVQPGGYGTT